MSGDRLLEYAASHGDKEFMRRKKLSVKDSAILGWAVYLLYTKAVILSALTVVVSNISTNRDFWPCFVSLPVSNWDKLAL